MLIRLQPLLAAARRHGRLAGCARGGGSRARMQHSASGAMSAAYQDLERILAECHSRERDAPKTGAGQLAAPMITRSPSALQNVALDSSSYAVQRPDICVMPTSVGQLQACVRYCYAHDIAMVPVGARTGLEGGIHAMRGGVSFDMTQMRTIRQMHAHDLDCHVEAGLSWRELNEQIRSSGLWFPVDPGASASLGGMASTSASGTNAVKFGTMRENVIGLELVARNGELIRTSGQWCRSKKSSAGLNLTNLFVGSEGTLGVISALRLRLHALPSCLAVSTVAFPDTRSAVEAVVQVMQCGIPIARIEFVDQPAVAACWQATKLPNLVPDRPMLFVELHALTEPALADQIDLLRELFHQNGASKFEWSSRLEERTELWKARHNLHWSILNTKPGFTSIDTDVCVPISKFPEMVAISHQLIREHRLDAPIMGHAGDGNFHSVILYDPGQADGLARAKELAVQMGLAAIRLGGTVTGEHGVGRGKVDLLEAQFDEASLELMYSIKRALDPKNLFNPGKMFKSERLATTC